MVKRISSGSPFEKRVGYSRAIIDGDMIYVAGTTGYDYDSMTMPYEVADQARNAIHTIAKTLAEAGSNLHDVLRVRYYITEPDHYEQIADVLGEAFGDIRPAATMIVTRLIRPEMKIEIEVTARKGARPPLV
jgi:enamine deaminase RidA (YjgF/YER057c/UK114 family)